MIVPISRLSVLKKAESVSFKSLPQTPGHGAAASVAPSTSDANRANPWLSPQIANSACAGLSALPSIEPMTYRAKAAATSPSTRSMTPPCPGMILPEILHAVTPLDPGFEQVADLRDDGKQERDQRKQRQVAEPGIGRERDAGDDTADRAADRAALRLAGRDGGRELRAAERPSDEIGKNVGRPYDGEEEQDRDETGLVAVAKPAERQAGEARIGKSDRRPRAPAPPSGCRGSSPATDRARRTRTPARRIARAPARSAPRRASAAATQLVARGRRGPRHRAPFVEHDAPQSTQASSRNATPPSNVTARTAAISTTDEMIRSWRLLISRAGPVCRSRGDALRDALRQTPPKRRSRAAYWRSASAKCSRVKSGQ